MFLSLQEVSMTMFYRGFSFRNNNLIFKKIYFWNYPLRRFFNHHFLTVDAPNRNRQIPRFLQLILLLKSNLNIRYLMIINTLRILENLTVWSIFFIKALSTGVRSIFSRMNSLSKFWVSSSPLLNNRDIKALLILRVSKVNLRLQAWKVVELLVFPIGPN